MKIDVEALRSYLLELCGSAAFTGFGAALADAAEVEFVDGEELLAIALRLGVDLVEFEAR